MTVHLHSYLDDIEASSTTEAIVDGEIEKFLNVRLADIEREMDSIQQPSLNELNTKLDRIIFLLEALQKADSVPKATSAEIAHILKKNLGNTD